MSSIDRLVVIVGVMLAGMIGGCASSPIERVRAYQAARESGDDHAAAAMLAPDARIWFETREGPGEPFAIGGPWAQWDREMRSRNTCSDYSSSGREVTLITTETNDFYRLVERAPSRARVTYTLDDAGRIASVLYVPLRDPPPPPDRLPQFKAWARANAAEEFERFAPGGKIVPGGEQARAWKALLMRWRREAGLPPVG